MLRAITPFLFLIFFIGSSVYSQSYRDSLISELSKKQDTIQILSYQLEIGGLYEFDNPDSARIYYEKALRIAETIGNDSIYLTAYMYIGYTFELLGRADTALSMYLSALEKFKDLDQKSGESSIYNALGNIYYYEGNFEEALKYYRQSLKIATEIKNELWQAYAFHNIGLVYADLKEYNTALDYYNKSLEIFLKYDDKSWLATCYNSIGSYYLQVDSLQKAKSNYTKGLVVYLELGDVMGISMLYDNLARISIKEKQYDTAFVYFNKALILAQEVDDYYSIASIYHGLADVSYRMKDYNAAIEFGKKSLIYSKQSDWKTSIISSYQMLKFSYANILSFREAFMYSDSLNILRKEVFDLEKTKTIQELEGKYQSKQKQLQIENLEKDKILKHKENKQQRVLLYLAFLGIVLVLAFSISLYRTVIAKKKANKKLKEQQSEIQEQNEELNQLVEETMTQKEEIEKQGDVLRLQNDELENTHLEINQSIDYAKRIQNSILPKTEDLDDILDSSFVVFKPKDKVSGDFYWWTKVEDETIITAADCTGHGVPGAFMSMLGISFLREIIIKEYITHPGVILRKLRKEIINALQQKGVTGEQKDGMDMSLVSINHKTLLMQYAGANNPIYIIRNKEIDTENKSVIAFGEKSFDDKVVRFYEIKPDKMPIAIYDNMSRFTTHEIQLEKGDQVYLFSDGFPDQFGGPKGKKFKYKPFKNLLLDYSNLPMQEQKMTLEKVFEEWIGEHEQIDDILILGIRV